MLGSLLMVALPGDNSDQLFFWLAAFVTSLLLFIVTSVTANAQIRRDVRVHGLGTEIKTCPTRAEQVLVVALKCKHCGEALQ